MQTITITHDIQLLCRKAGTFPEGVLEAFQFLEKTNPEFRHRTFYGLSRGNKEGGIDYWAAAELKHTSEKTEGTETKTVRAGTYACIEVINFRKNISAIAEAFKQLLLHPQMDLQSFCVEKYSDSDHVHCMIRLKL